MTTRDTTLDVLRGLAVALMVLGHLAMQTLRPPEIGHPFYLEMLVGIAPPLFLVVAGMLVANAAWRRGSVRRPLVRCAQLLGLGALIDILVWGVVPFVTFDILYLIGVSLPAAYLAATRVPLPGRWVLALAFILLAPLLQKALGYSDYPVEFMLDGTLVTEIDMEMLGTFALEPKGNVLYNWLFDGWFPLFPWLGFSLLGAAVAWPRWRGGSNRRFGVWTGLLPGLVLLAAGLLLGWAVPEFEITPRHRWGGAFAPPGWGYLVASIGETALLFFLVDLRPGLVLLRPLALLGRHALLIYATHLGMLWVLGRAIDERFSYGPYLLIYVGLISVLGALAAVVEAWRRRHSLRARSTAPTTFRARRTR